VTESIRNPRLIINQVQKRCAKCERRLKEEDEKCPGCESRDVKYT